MGANLDRVTRENFFEIIFKLGLEDRGGASHTSVLNETGAGSKSLRPKRACFVQGPEKSSVLKLARFPFPSVKSLPSL